MRIVLALSFPLLAVACASAPKCPATPPPPAPPAATTASASQPKDAPHDDAPGAKTPEEALARLFTSKKIDAAWFTESFVHAVPVAKVQAIVDDVKAEGGAFRKIEKTADGWSTVLDKGTVPTSIALDKTGRIGGLFFRPMELTHPPPVAETLAAIRALHGKTSVLVQTDGKDVVAHEPEAALAVGSAFKLAILDAVRQRIEAKKAGWRDVVALKPERKSAPSGFLHEWPDGAPLTVYALAGLMISQSDNTATDVLLDWIGRGAVEKIAGADVPFLATREAFVLKASSSAPLLSRWREGDEAARRKLLVEIDKTKPPAPDGSGDPRALDVEWHMGARKLCELLSRNKDLPVMHINPGVASAKQWDLVAFKGGSEPGVLNLSTWVEKGPHKHCVVTTWNDDATVVELGKLSALHTALLATLREAK